MNFNEYKSAEYWQQERRVENDKICHENCKSTAAISTLFCLFPILYCLASLLDG